MKLTLPTIPDALREQHASKGWPLALLGSVLLFVSGLLSWSYDASILGDISISFWPATLQLFAMILGAVGILLALIHKGPLQGLGNWFDSALALRALGTGSLLFAVYSLTAIAYEAGGLVNINPGGWLAFIGALVLTIGARFVPAAHLAQLREGQGQLHPGDRGHRHPHGAGAFRCRLCARPG